MPVQSFIRFASVALAVSVVVACGEKAPETASQQQALTTTQTQQYAMMEGDSVGPVCVHLDMPYSVRICPDSNFANYFLPSQVTAETLIVRANNRTIRIPLPERTDAIFLTRSAMSTFLLRHYDATDPAAAAELRTFMANGRYRAP